MSVMRKGLRLSVLLACFCWAAASQQQDLSVTGTLQRMAGIGGESTGWGVELDAAMNFGGRQVRSVEIASKNIQELDRLAGKRVTVTGKLGRRKGVETGERAVLEVASIREASSGPGLAGEWLLEDLAGSGVVDRVQATLEFPAAGRVSGSGSCNRFMGSVEMKGESVKFGPLATTRKACPPAVMDQESKYLKALAAAERVESKDPFLLVHCKGYDKPLRFTRKTTAAASAKGDLTQLFSRVWRVVKAPSPPVPGSIFVFLPNGTFLQTSCGETYRIAKWSVDKSAPTVLRVIEDGRPAYTAAIEELSNSTLRLRLELSRSKEMRALVLEGIEKEVLCPDLRK